MFISAFEPLLAISFVVKATVVTPPDNVTAPVNVPVVAVNAATSNAPAVTVMPPDLSAPVAVVVPNLKFLPFVLLPNFHSYLFLSCCSV